MQSEVYAIRSLRNQKFMQSEVCATKRLRNQEYNKIKTQTRHLEMQEIKNRVPEISS